MLPTSVYSSLSPFQVSHFLTFLSSSLISQNDSWDPKLSWLSAIAPNMQHGNILDPRNPHAEQLVWKPYCTHCMLEEFLDCLIDTSTKSSATHEAFLNPTFPWGFISIWGFSPSCSVSYDFHAEGFHELFLKKQNKQPKAATVRVRLSTGILKQHVHFPPKPSTEDIMTMKAETKIKKA